MLHERKVLVTLMTPDEISADEAEVEVLELLEALTQDHHFNAASVHVVALEKAL